MRRLASVCTGAFLLAEAGLLDGRRATTHWASCARARAPLSGASRVEPDPIFVRDGNVYTSAGVTAGMDLALALVEEDHGRELALAVARRLVLFLKRPGGQSQFSAQLAVQAGRARAAARAAGVDRRATCTRISRWRRSRRAPAMSPRNFARVFTREVGVTPARFVETARVEAARRRLEETAATASRPWPPPAASAAPRRCAARSCGALRVSPAAYRSRFRAAAQLKRRQETTHGHHDRDPALRRRRGARLRGPVGGVHDGRAQGAGRPRGHDRAEARARCAARRACA